MSKVNLASRTRVFGKHHCPRPAKFSNPYSESSEYLKGDQRDLATHFRALISRGWRHGGNVYARGAENSRSLDDTLSFWCAPLPLPRLFSMHRIRADRCTTAHRKGKLPLSLPSIKSARSLPPLSRSLIVKGMQECTSFDRLNYAGVCAHRFRVMNWCAVAVGGSREYRAN